MSPFAVQAAAQFEPSAGISVGVIAAIIAAVIVFAVIRNRNTTTAKDTGRQIEGLVIGSRVHAHVNAPFEGILGVGAGAYDVRHSGNGTTVTKAAMAAVGIGPDGRPAAAIGAGIGVSRGWDPLHNYAPDKVDYDVALLIKYTDPSTGKADVIQQKSGMGELVRHLPFESRVLSHASFANIVDPIAVADGFTAIQDAMREAQRLHTSGASADEISDHFSELNDRDRTGFVRLHAPVPVTLWVDDSKPRDERFEYEFVR